MSRTTTALVAIAAPTPAAVRTFCASCQHPLGGDNPVLAHPEDAWIAAVERGWLPLGKDRYGRHILICRPCQRPARGTAQQCQCHGHLPGVWESNGAMRHRVCTRCSGIQVQYAEELCGGQG